MAWIFGDSFDLYNSIADAVPSYWDGTNGVNFALVAGRFANSRAITLALGASSSLVKSSGSNDAVHHFNFAIQQTTAISGSNPGAGFILFDGATAQCTVQVNGGGSIVLMAGNFGTVLATYSGALIAPSTWYSFEVEVVVNNTTGSFTVRKNGNPVNDFQATNLNTRGSANNYANKLQISSTTGGNTSQPLDDILWRSDPVSVSWAGDIRCYARMPASDQSVTFSRSPTNFLAQVVSTPGAGNSLPGNTIRFISLSAPTSGILTSLVFNFNSAMTGHAKMALYDTTGASGGPGALMVSTVELTNPGPGLVAFTIAGGPTLQRGVVYWIALWSDAAVVSNANTPTLNYQSLALTYTTSFPSSAVGFAVGGNTAMNCAGMNMTPFNAGCVNEPQQDGATSYVYDNNPGDADFYGIGSIATTPAQIIATTVRAFAQKSDAGTRTLAVQLKSGATTVASPTIVLTTSGFLWAWRTDLTDPNTGAAWTPTAVNNAQIGPKVIA